MKSLRQNTRLDRLVNRTAVGVTRRRVLRDAGGVAAGAALGTAFLATGERPQEALANHVLACGPSPYCGQTHCYSNGKCHEHSLRKPRWYNGTVCKSDQPSSENCWWVCLHGYRCLCCDCCVGGNYPGDYCNSSSCGGGEWHKCICRSDAGVHGYC